MFLHRLISTVTLLCVLFIIVFFSHGITSVLVPVILTFLAAGGIQEYYFMMQAKNIQGRSKFLIFISTIYIWLVYLNVKCEINLVFLDSTFVFLLLLSQFIFHILKKQKLNEDSMVLDEIAHAVLCFLYVPFCLSFMMKILYFQGVDGRNFILFLILVAKGTDILSYVSGKLMGKHKLISWVSPNKTIEGAIGGIFGAFCVGLILFFICLKQDASLIFAIISSFLIPFVSLIGDLAESVLKRITGCKDSGVIIPGMGGVLDLTDSILMTAPFLFFMMVYFI